MRQLRADKSGTHRVQFEHNKKKILKTQDICAICGKEVDKTIKYPNPMSPVIDHIIPIAKGGHPSDINNLQLTHMKCNREKGDKLYLTKEAKVIVGNRMLPQSRDWSKYRGA